MILRKISKAKLKIILEKHEKWLNNEPDGERANLKSANLEFANLEFANLEFANLESANLKFANLKSANLKFANLKFANLKSAHLKSANLKSANLESANLKFANLEYANLKSAHLESANLKSANLDFSCFPLWCGSFNIKVDERLIWQLIAHITRLDTKGCNKETKTAIKAIWKYRNKFCKYRTDVKEI